MRLLHNEPASEEVAAGEPTREEPRTEDPAPEEAEWTETMSETAVRPRPRR